MERTMDALLDRYFDTWLGMDAVYEKWAAHRGVTFNMLGVFDLLHRQGGVLPQAELCRRLHLSKQTVASVVDSLEKRGLALRRASETDRRTREVCLTGEGRAAARALSEALRRFERRAFAMLPPEEQHALVETLVPPAAEHGGRAGGGAGGGRRPIFLNKFMRPQRAVFCLPCRKFVLYYKKQYCAGAAAGCDILQVWGKLFEYHSRMYISFQKDRMQIAVWRGSGGTNRGVFHLSQAGARHRAYHALGGGGRL